MTPQDTMRLALESHLKNERYRTHAETVYWCKQYKLLAQQAIEALSQQDQDESDLLTIAHLDGYSKGKADADPNAPWMTEAHCLCSDHGIPHGNLTGRIRALRDKLAQQVDERPKLNLDRQQGEQQPVACPYCHASATLGVVYFDQNCTGCVKRMGSAGAAPAAQPDLNAAFAALREAANGIGVQK